MPDTPNPTLSEITSTAVQRALEPFSLSDEKKREVIAWMCIPANRSCGLRDAIEIVEAIERLRGVR